MKSQWQQVDEGPSISIVIPVFNGDKYIREALDSVFAQTYRRFEVIVVDDGSTDRTLEIVGGYPDVKVIKQRNKGNAAARNRGIAMATGEWTAQLDADDRWDATKLEKQVRQTTGADVVYTAAANFGATSRVGDITFRDRDCPQGDVFGELIAANFVPHSSVMVRTQLLREHGGYDESLRTICDWDLWLRLSAAGARFAGCREPLTHYRWNAASISRNHHQTRQDRLTVVARALDSPRGRRVSAARKRQVTSRVWQTSAWFVAEQDNWTALRWYATALTIWPFSVSGWRDLVRSALHVCGLSRARLLKSDRFDAA